MSTTRQVNSQSAAPLRWRTVDLITTVMIGVVFGVIFIGWGSLTNLTSPLFLALPPLSGLLGGFWWLPAVVAALVIRRPGAALLVKLVADRVGCTMTTVSRRLKAAGVPARKPGGGTPRTTWRSCGCAARV